MKDDLCGTDAVETSVTVDLAVSTDGFHIALLCRLDPPAVLDHFLAFA